MLVAIALLSADPSEPVAEPAVPALTLGCEPAEASPYTLVPGAWEEVLAQPERLTHSARLVPYRRDDQVLGMRLHGIRPDSPIQSCGLRPGDVVLSINERPLRTLEELQTIWQEEQDARLWTLRVERDGQVLDLVVQQPAPPAP